MILGKTTMIYKQYLNLVRRLLFIELFFVEVARLNKYLTGRYGKSVDKDLTPIGILWYRCTVLCP